jgi:SAM-dependent methyltransferase
VTLDTNTWSGDSGSALAHPGASQVAGSLENLCEYDAESGIWRLRDGRTIPYPNDRFAASKLEYVLRNADDLSSLSPELEGFAGQWPASYYLSTKRSSLLRGFSWDQDSDVLEVGAGCGTISRFLGETFRSVLAVEGEPHRARLARLRTRDQPNVQVLNAPYEDISFKKQFDLVFCVGVLEYASTFFGVENAPLNMVRGMREILGDDGVLVLAIENQLGLKYFAGSAEDHTALPFDGIEGYARSSKRRIETFSRVRLSKMLELAGFQTLDFFFPFPDYKFPRSVISERAANHDSPAMAGLIAHEGASDYLLPPSPQLFNQSLAWREALGAGLVPDLANSFLVMATPAASRSSRWSAPWDAVSISVGNRLPAYWSQTRLTGLGTDHPVVDRRQLLPDRPADPRVTVELPYTETWYDTPTLGVILERVMQDPDCGVEQIADALKPWKLFLDESFGRDGSGDGSLFDAVPQNMVLVGGELRMFDHELRTRAPVAKSTMMIRGIHLTLIGAAQSPGAITRLRRRRYWPLILEIAAQLDEELTTLDLCRAALFEYRVQRATTGHGRVILMWPIDLRLRRVRSFRRRQQARILARSVYRLARRLQAFAVLWKA